MLRVISPFGEGYSAAGRLNAPPAFDKAPGDYWRKLLSLPVISHASLAVSFHFMSLPIFPATLQFPVLLFCPSSLPPLPPCSWISFVISLTFLLPYFWPTRLTGQPLSETLGVASSLPSSLLFMWQRPEPVKGWKPDKEKGLMIGKVARATHKHFRHVNKCERAQRAAQ